MSITIPLSSWLIPLALTGLWFLAGCAWAQKQNSGGFASGIAEAITGVVALAGVVFGWLVIWLVYFATLVFIG